MMILSCMTIVLVTLTIQQYADATFIPLFDFHGPPMKTHFFGPPIHGPQMMFGPPPMHGPSFHKPGPHLLGPYVQTLPPKFMHKHPKMQIHLPPVLHQKHLMRPLPMMQPLPHKNVYFPKVNNPYGYERNMRRSIPLYRERGLEGSSVNSGIGYYRNNVGQRHGSIYDTTRQNSNFRSSFSHRRTNPDRTALSRGRSMYTVNRGNALNLPRLREVIDSGNRRLISRNSVQSSNVGGSLKRKSVRRTRQRNNGKRLAGKTIDMSKSTITSSKRSVGTETLSSNLLDKTAAGIHSEQLSIKKQRMRGRKERTRVSSATTSIGSNPRKDQTKAPVISQNLQGSNHDSALGGSLIDLSHIVEGTGARGQNKIAKPVSVSSSVAADTTAGINAPVPPAATGATGANIAATAGANPSAAAAAAAASAAATAAAAAAAADAAGANIFALVDTAAIAADANAAIAGTGAGAAVATAAANPKGSAINPVAITEPIGSHDLVIIDNAGHAGNAGRTPAEVAATVLPSVSNALGGVVDLTATSADMSGANINNIGGSNVDIYTLDKSAYAQLEKALQSGQTVDAQVLESILSRSGPSSSAGTMNGRPASPVLSGNIAANAPEIYFLDNAQAHHLTESAGFAGKVGGSHIVDSHTTSSSSTSSKKLESSQKSSSTSSHSAVDIPHAGKVLPAGHSHTIPRGHAVHDIVGVVGKPVGHITVGANTDVRGLFSMPKGTNIPNMPASLSSIPDSIAQRMSGGHQHSGHGNSHQGIPTDMSSLLGHRMTGGHAHLGQGATLRRSPTSDSSLQGHSTSSGHHIPGHRTHK